MNEKILIFDPDSISLLCTVCVTDNNGGKIALTVIVSSLILLGVGNWAWKKYFVNKKEIYIIKNRRITTSNTHGTGCTLSSAITTFFSCGKTLKKSCELATKYVNQSIRSNLNYGKGHGPINHLSSVLIKKEFR